MTRARDRLDLIMPQRFFVTGQATYGDRHVHAARMRFVPDVLLPFFETVSRPEAGPDDVRAGDVAPEIRIDLGAQMREMWQ